MENGSKKELAISKDNSIIFSRQELFQICVKETNMEKTFEDQFMELQADMVSVCLEYIGRNAKTIYIYCSYESNMYSFDVFYEVNNVIIHSHKVNDIITDESKKIDTSPNRQGQVLDIGIDDLEKIHKLCIANNRDMPTEFKLVYDVEHNNLNTNYKYELQYSNTDDLQPDFIFEKWYEEVKHNVEG